jgi:hypothetical protein
MLTAAVSPPSSSVVDADVGDSARAPPQTQLLSLSMRRWQCIHRVTKLGHRPLHRLLEVAQPRTNEVKRDIGATNVAAVDWDTDANARAGNQHGEGAAPLRSDAPPI